MQIQATHRAMPLYILYYIGYMGVRSLDFLPAWSTEPRNAGCRSLAGEGRLFSLEAWLFQDLKIHRSPLEGYLQLAL